MSFGLIAGLAHLRIDNSGEAFLSKYDPERVRYDAFRRRYESDDTIHFMHTFIRHYEETGDPAAAVAKPR